MLVHAFTEMLQQLFKLDGVKFVYSERFCQDNVEIFFGKQRARGRRNDNPTVEQFLQNSQAIIVGRSLALGHSSNIRKRTASISIDRLNSPLRKRQSKRRCLSYDLQ